VSARTCERQHTSAIWARGGGATLWGGRARDRRDRPRPFRRDHSWPPRCRRAWRSRRHASHRIAAAAAGPKQWLILASLWWPAAGLFRSHIGPHTTSRRAWCSLSRSASYQDRNVQLIAHCRAAFISEIHSALVVKVLTQYWPLVCAQSAVEGVSGLATRRQGAIKFTTVYNLVLAPRRTICIILKCV